MQVIPAIIGGQHTVWMVWVANGPLKIDDTIERLATADPFVHGFSLSFLLRREVTRRGRAFQNGVSVAPKSR